MTVLLVALGGALGAPLRFLLAHRLDDALPRGTFVANAAGSLLLGLLSGLAVSGHVLAFAGVGFCGALTTYSGFAVGAHRLGARLGTAYAVATVLTAVLLCTVGFWIGAA